MLFVTHPVADTIHEGLTINNDFGFQNQQGWHLNVVQRFWSRMAQTGSLWNNHEKYLKQPFEYQKHIKIWYTNHWLYVYHANRDIIEQIIVDDYYSTNGHNRFSAFSI